jgi:hypothetical protein
VLARYDGFVSASGLAASRSQVAEGPQVDIFEQVAEFRNLDARRIQISRQEVLSRYLDQKPNGYAGDIGIIRGQIERKRGHFPVRKLINEAGGAVRFSSLV